MSDQKTQPHSVRLLKLVEKLGAALEIEDARLLMEAAQTAERLESGEGFNCKPVVSMRTGQALLDCSWMGMLAQITPDQARSMALGMIATAAEAETDAVMLAFLRSTGLSEERAAHAVATVRSMRAERQEVVGEKQEPQGVNVLQHLTPHGSKPF